MSSRLGKNLRSGHLAEDLGVLVLRRFCAVAQIRQEDDYGIDAVATLLKPDSGLLYAERSFMVQIKSASIKEIVYKNHEVTWLLSQDLPLFFCIVDTNNDSISLYTTNRLYKHLMFFGQVKKITLILGDNPNTFEGIIIPLGENNLENYSPVEEELDLEIYLGQPIFETTEKESRSNNFVENAYELMAEWLDIEYYLMPRRMIGYTRLAYWETGKKPKLGFTISGTNYKNLKNDMLEAKVYIEKMASYIGMDDKDGKVGAEAILLLKSYYEAKGIELECNEYNLHKKIDPSLFD